jgi:hypothetical protein
MPDPIVTQAFALRAPPRTTAPGRAHVHRLPRVQGVTRAGERGRNEPYLRYLPAPSGRFSQSVPPTMQSITPLHFQRSGLPANSHSRCEGANPGAIITLPPPGARFGSRPDRFSASLPREDNTRELFTDSRPRGPLRPG